MSAAEVDRALAAPALVPRMVARVPAAPAPPSRPRPVVLAPAGAEREATRQRLYRECQSVLLAIAQNYAGRFNLAAALDALEQREAGDALAWIDYLGRLRRGEGAGPTAAEAARPTRRERTRAARWAPTIEVRPGDTV
jgi:hypothetical protein